MEKIYLKAGDEVPTIDGVLKIDRYNGSGVYWCDRYVINENGELQLEEKDVGITASDFSRCHREVTGENAKFICGGE